MKLPKRTTCITFRFFKDEPNHVAVQYKLWSTEQHWHPLPNEPRLEIFNLTDEEIQILPSGIPELVKPDFHAKQDFVNIKKNFR